VFDNKTIIMSSSSWTYYSFVINHEGLLSIPSPAAVEKSKSVFEQEWKRGTTP
jgi:phosphatidylserine/phosphatidylglycerophosphate/cardiolipin synthase-like enzyme